MFFIRLLSRMPWFILVGISNLMYLLVYRIGRYRYSVVSRNLLNSFPEKSDQERKQLARRFYRGFFDFIIETLKLLTLSEKGIRKRVTFSNPEIFDEIEGDGACIVLGTHFLNWEIYVTASDEKLSRQLVFGYQKLNNAFFNKLIYIIRTKFGGEGMIRHETAKTILKGRKDHKFFYILGDQAPVGKAKRYWTRFLNQKTSFYHGVGQISKLSQLPVLILLPRRKERFTYEVEFAWINKVPGSMESEEILDKYIDLLEQQIVKYPEDWLWTHKRWKTKLRDEDIISEKLKSNG